MKAIMDLVDRIDDEIESAKSYAESYLEKKAESSDWAQKYKEMSTEELKHAINLHDIAIERINKISEVYNPPVAMQEIWDKAHAEYVERIAWIRQMLAM